MQGYTNFSNLQELSQNCRPQDVYLTKFSPQRPTNIRYRRNKFSLSGGLVHGICAPLFSCISSTLIVSACLVIIDMGVQTLIEEKQKPREKNEQQETRHKFSPHNFYMCCSVHLHDNNSLYPTNAHSVLCKTLHWFANMFRSIGIIIRAPHTLNIVVFNLFLTRCTEWYVNIYKSIYSVHTTHL